MNILHTRIAEARNSARRCEHLTGAVPAECVDHLWDEAEAHTAEADALAAVRTAWSRS